MGKYLIESQQPRITIHEPSRRTKSLFPKEGESDPFTEPVRFHLTRSLESFEFDAADHAAAQQELVDYVERTSVTDPTGTVHSGRPTSLLYKDGSLQLPIPWDVLKKLGET